MAWSGEADYRRRTEHEQLAQGLVALAADAALPASAAGGMVFRGKAEPRRKVSPGTEDLGVNHPESKADRANWSDAGLARQTLAQRVSRCNAISRVSISLSLTSSPSR
jgi:hypothetical protein